MYHNQTSCVLPVMLENQILTAVTKSDITDSNSGTRWDIISAQTHKELENVTRRRTHTGAQHDTYHEGATSGKIVSCVGNSPLNVAQTQQWPDKEVT